jgi:DNA-binding transcriptional MerR regulator
MLRDTNKSPALAAKAASLRGSRKSSATENDEKLFTIGDLAREFGVTLRTLRFYEDRGLITPRRSGMTRLYNESARERVGLILKGKHLGFTLTEIRAMLEAEEKGASELKLGRAQVAEQIEHLERQKLEIEQAITELRATLARLG